MRDSRQRKLDDGILNFSSLLDLASNIPGIVYRSYVHDGHRMDFFNNELKKITGYSENELAVGTVCNLDPLIIPEDRARVISVVEKAIEELKPFRVEYRLRRKDGGIVWLVEHGTPIHDVKSNVFYIDGVIFDNTGIKLMEIALRESEKNFKGLFQSSPEAILFLDKEGFVKDVNKKGLDLVGYSLDELVGKSIFKLPFLSKESRLIALRKLTDRLMGKYVPPYDLEIITKNGSRVTGLISGSPISDAGNNVIGDMVIIQDVTEAKKAEVTLKESENKFRFLVDKMHEISIILNKTGSIIFANRSSLETFGYSESEVIGKNITDFLIKGSLKKAFWALSEEFLGKHHGEFEVEVKNKKGEIRTLQIAGSSNPIHKNGKIVGILINALDITDSKRSDEALKESEERYRTVYNSSSDAIMLLAPPDWRFTSGNPTILRLFNVKDEQEFTSLNPWKLSPKFQPDGQLSSVKARKMIMKAMREGSNFFEWTHKRFNGEEFPATVLLTRMTIKGKHLLQAIVRDIAEAKNAEIKLVNEKKWSDLLVKAAPNIIIGLGKDSRILLFNDFAKKLTGYKSEEVIGKRWIDLFIPKSNRETLYRVWASIVRKKLIAHHYVNSIILKDGSERLISWNNTVLTDDGNFRMVLSIGEDITESKLAENILHESESKFKGLFNKMSDAAFLADIQTGLIVDANLAAERLTGKSRRELIGMHQSILHADVKEGKRLFHDYVALNEGREVESTVINAKGKIIPVLITVSLIKFDGKQIALGIFKDITERKHIQDKLVENYEFINRILSESPSPIWVSDNQGNIIRVNKSLERMLNLTSREIVGYYNILKDAQVIKQGFLPLIKSVYENGRTVKFVIDYETVKEKQVSVKVPVKRVIEITISPIYDSKNNISRAICIENDITERVKLERLLTESAVKYDALYSLSNDLIQSVNDKGRIINVNNAWLKATGYSRKEALKLNFIDIIAPGCREHCMDLFRNVLSGKAALDISTTFLRKNGDELLVEGSSYPIMSDGKFVSTWGVFKDVTESKKNAYALQVSETRYRRLFEAARDGILILDVDTGKIMDVNPYLVEMLGYSRNEFLGKNIWDIGYFKDVVASKNAFYELRSKGYIHYDNLSLKTKNGKEFRAEFVSNVYTVDTKKVIQCNIRDITERKIAEDALKESEEKFRGLFANAQFGIASHELILDKHKKPIDYKILDVNPSYESIVKLKRIDVINKKASIVYNSKKAPYLDIYSKVALSGNSFNFETFFEPLKKYFSISVFSPKKGFFATLFEDITERKKAEDEIKSLARFPSENPNPIIRVVNNKVSYANTSGLNFLGETKSGIGKHLPLLLDDLVIKALKSNMKNRIEYPVDSKVYLVNITPFVNENYVNLYLTDITYQKTAEDNIRKSEEKYKSLFENANEGLVSLDLKGNVLSVNPEGVRMFGIPENKIVGKSVFNFVNQFGVDSRTVFSVFKDVIQGKPFNQKEWNVKTSNNENAVILINTWFIKKNNKTTGITVSVRDVTELKKAEEKLRESEETFRNIFDSATDGMVVIDLTGKITRVNKRVIEISGYSSNELIGNRFTSLRLISPKELLRVSGVFARFIVNPESVSGVEELEIITKQGTKLIMEYKGSPLIKNGRLSGAVVIMRDVTERKRLEQIERDAKIQNELEGLRSNFVMMITHELKQPLTPIAGYASLLKDSVKTPLESEYLDKIVNNTFRMRDMINKILTLLKLEAGTLTFKFRKDNLSKVINEVLLEKQSMIELKKLVINKDIKSVNLIFDYEHLKDVLINLIDNAIKFTGENGKIDIKSWYNLSNAYISVKDSGVGIRKEDLPKLFKKFYQTVEGGRAGGTGIGLSVARSIVESHKGSIIVKSEFGKGSEFIVKLPRRGLK